MKKQHLLPILAILGLVSCGGGDNKTTDKTTDNDGAPEPVASASADASGGASADASADASGGVPYLTELPPELIEGTPVPITLPNLEPALASAPELVVADGTVLLSAGKTVTSSDDFPLIGSLDLITDGGKDAGEGFRVEIAEGKQWIQIDLEQEAAIHVIHVWHYHAQRRAYKGVIARISSDPEFSEGATTVFNNDFENIHGLGRGADRPYVETRFGKAIDGRGTVGRYIRLYSAGNTSNDSNHYIEVEVHGIPVE